MDDIDRSFEQLKEIEGRIKSCSTEAEKISPKLIEAQEAAKQIMEKQGKIGSAVEKLESLDSMLDAADERIQNVKNSQQWLAEIETRMNHLHRELESDVLAIESAPSAPRRKVKSSTTEKTYDTVKTLMRQGWKMEEIAAKLNISVGEISLILEGWNELDS